LKRSWGIVKAKAIIFVMLLVFIIPQPVSAYLDPGFGSMVWQLIVTVLLGVAFTLKMYWQKIRNCFSKSTPKTPRE
jgi:uncharacterized integral membrane protein